MSPAFRPARWTVASIAAVLVLILVVVLVGRWSTRPSSLPRIYPALKDSCERHRNTTVRVIVSFPDTLRLPVFPALGVSGQPDSVVLDSIRALVNHIELLRSPAYTIETPLLDRFGGSSKHAFWIVNAIAVDMLTDSVLSLAQHDTTVRYIEPAFSGEPPPDCATDPAHPAVAVARGQIGSDAYVTDASGPALKGTVHVALLDTGVDTMHVLLQKSLGPKTGVSCVGCRVASDTSLLNADCGGASGDVYTSTSGHGTTTAAIMIGNESLGSDTRGIGPIWVDGIRVYKSNGLDREAVLCGFERSIELGDRIVIAEVQADVATPATLSDAANQAFLAGQLVISAAGDQHPSSISVSTVKEPGIARNGIAVGAYQACQGAVVWSQSSGIVNGMSKPEVQGPTETVSAANVSGGVYNATHGLGNTSGSTPYVAGTAALLWTWLEQYTGARVQAGEIAAALVMCGRNATLRPADTGAGHIVLPPPNAVATGVRGISMSSSQPYQEVRIPLAVTAGQNVEAALWWSGEFSFTGGNSLVQLSIVYTDGSGKDVVVPSTHAIGCMDRITVNVPPSSTRWRLRLTPIQLNTPVQPVYWAVALRNG